MNNVEFVKSLYAAFLSGGIDRILAVADPHIECKSNVDPALLPWGGDRHGVREIAAYFSELGQHVEIESFSPLEFHSGTGFVMVMGRTAGRMRRSGVRFDDEWCHFFRIVGGKVLAFRQYSDTHALVQAFVGGDVHAIGLPSSAAEPMSPRSH